MGRTGGSLSRRDWLRAALNQLIIVAQRGPGAGWAGRASRGLTPGGAPRPAGPGRTGGRDGYEPPAAPPAAARRPARYRYPRAVDALA